MHIGLLFYADTLIMAATSGGVKGRAVANNGFLKALITHAEGHVITIIVSSEIEKQLFQPLFAECRPVCHVELVSLLNLAEHLKTHPLDVLHVMDVNLYKGFHIRNRLSLNSFPVTGVTHTLGHAPFFEWMTLNLTENPMPHDTLVCTTPTAERVIQNIQNAVAKKINVGKRLNTAQIPLGIFTQALTRAHPGIRASLKIPDGTTVFLSLGRFTNITKVDLIPFLIAFKSVVESCQDDVRWILAGAVEHEHYFKFLEKTVRDEGLGNRISFLPNPTEEQKLSLLSNSDVFLAPCDNTQETFGLSVIEALCAGLPVIASDWDGYRSLIKDGENGFLIPTLMPDTCQHLDAIAPLQRDSFNQLAFAQAVATDSEKFSEALTRLAHDKNLRDEMSRHARETGANHTWSNVIRQYLKLWGGLAKASVNDAGPAVTSVPSNHQVPGTDCPSTPPLDYHDVFRHYATQTLKPEHRVQTSPRGHQSLNRQALLYRLYDMEEILDLNLLSFILKTADQSVSVQMLCEKLPQAHPDKLKYHILWAYKFGLVTVRS